MEIDPLRSSQSTWAMTHGQVKADQQASQEPDIIKAVGAVNETGYFGDNYELTFTQDDTSRRSLVKLIDRETREVIRQFPPEYVLRLARESAKRR